MLEKLKFLYGEEKGKQAALEIEKLILGVKTKIKRDYREFWSEKDIFLITYADSFQEKNTLTLKTLSKILQLHLKGIISGVHILPFYPFSSDRGFSITDYQKVKKEFGTWDDIIYVANNYRLMADLVLNHVSVKHEWFQEFLRGNPKYENYFISFEEDKVPWEDLKKVIRSRSTPLVTPFETKNGKRQVWTTYSVGNFTDQVDLNYQNTEVLLEIIKVLLNLLVRGVRIFRLDAISSIWKELGTTCRNLPQTHTIIKLIRQILDELCPSALLVTEVNTSSLAENIKYLGDGKDEAQIFYNFPLAAVLLHTFYSGNSSRLNELIMNLPELKPGNSLFNILDIHDGYNTHLAKEYLTESEFTKVFKKVEQHGGKFSYRIGPDGKKIIKEMNITWWSAITDKEDPFDLKLRKFITSRAISMAIRGIPAVYYLSFVGGENDYDLLGKSKHARDINRTRLNHDLLTAKLADPTSKEAKVLDATVELIKKRKWFKAFHPNSRQEILELDDRVFVVLRGDGSDQVIALHNFSNDQVEVKYKDKGFILEPYGFLWKLINF
ncbi:hypothetical protein A2954_04785 [Candidatus Roizmanbacteria bacterium RIFCSPLOWO2_01_FULL_37_12]|uniref:Glycosyl hydrolase family 13 catalytic domain-containing protein n=1 Tax=Candidatus Roizmanbacteria bacterium RIFCSPLOWO2_01_FULL_37_12 TaxID=1802056 RepID=A0A1F7IG11_9BACT|nr:MAG: hypothetical protein A2768_00850 [Candidatus Roizmanbacteria bacterium RIFCSPHIGHO2_01_FULL_37_16]OGK24307.1 MAG: hypothetical protein A3D76_02605 [Candidatus Roizmanbacteria bacterium RIFCSPHIGHO2_02_FULL_37_9b]OGK42295.1 MAG: hypothetical protein A2954_04785 [Candidatus Roizmanbacteria bacterium RIFCSPLOWO2_01_FULL_37_12]